MKELDKDLNVLSQLGDISDLSLNGDKIEQERNCEKCHGFIGIPGKIYGFAGKWCNCYMTEQLRDADDKKWAENNEEMIERMRQMVNDYDRKKLSEILHIPEDNAERIKNCKYVHIGGSGYCVKCGGVHEVLNLKGDK